METTTAARSCMPFGFGIRATLLSLIVMLSCFTALILSRESAWPIISSLGLTEPEEDGSRSVHISSNTRLTVDEAQSSQQEEPTRVESNSSSDSGFRGVKDEGGSLLGGASQNNSNETESKATEIQIAKEGPRRPSEGARGNESAPVTVLTSTSNNTNIGQDLAKQPIFIGSYPFIGLRIRFGRTCNHLKSIATLMYLAEKEGRGVALETTFSQTLDHTGLDIAWFTRYNRNVSVLLDCYFIKGFTEASCRRHYINGERTNGTKFTAKIARMVNGKRTFYEMLHTIEIMNVMLWFRLPEADENVVDGILERLRAASKSRVTIGVHHRALEGHCYSFLVSNMHAPPYIQVPPYKTHALFSPGGRCFNVTENGLKMDESIESCYREISMLNSLCNFTFSAEETRYLQQVSGWGNFLNSKDFGLLLATDKQLPYGDAAIRKSVPVTFQLEDLLPKKYSEIGLLMLEMYALSRTDYFISQPVSSCDWIVHDWRVRRWNRPINATFPPNQIVKYGTVTANGTYEH